MTKKIRVSFGNSETCIAKTLDDSVDVSLSLILKIYNIDIGTHSIIYLDNGDKIFLTSGVEDLHEFADYIKRSQIVRLFVKRRIQNKSKQKGGRKTQKTAPNNDTPYITRVVRLTISIICTLLGIMVPYPGNYVFWLYVVLVEFRHRDVYSLLVKVVMYYTQVKRVPNKKEDKVIVNNLGDTKERLVVMGFKDEKKIDSLLKEFGGSFDKTLKELIK